MFRVFFSSRDREMGRRDSDGGRGGYYDPVDQDTGSYSRPGYQEIPSGIVHPGIDVYFDVAFLNDHCGKVLHRRDFKLF